MGPDIQRIPGQKRIRAGRSPPSILGDALREGRRREEFLANLCCKREELATAGVTVTEKEYERTIMRFGQRDGICSSSYLFHA